MAAAASSGRSLLRPVRAVPKTLLMATDRNDDATYGRSLTYWPSENPLPLGPLPSLRTRPTGSTSNQERGRAPIVAGVRIHDVHLTEGQVGAVHPVRVL